MANYTVKAGEHGWKEESVFNGLKVALLGYSWVLSALLLCRYNFISWVWISQSACREFCDVHSWQNGTKCRDGMKVMWCHPLVGFWGFHLCMHLFFCSCFFFLLEMVREVKLREDAWSVKCEYTLFCCSQRTNSCCKCFQLKLQIQPSNFYTDRSRSCCPCKLYVLGCVESSHFYLQQP